MRVDFSDAGLNQDPYPVFEEIRRTGPVVYNELGDHWMVTGYRDAARALGDGTHFAQNVVAGGGDFFGGPTMESIDDRTHHDAVREIWAPDFRRDQVERRRSLVEQVVEAQLGPFVERLRAGETVDAIAHLTRAIPTLVIAHLLGIDTSMFEQFSAWSDAMGAMTDADFRTEEGLAKVTAGRRASAALNEYIASQVADRRRSPDSDLISTMTKAPYAATGMSEKEIIASNTQLVFAGNETTAKLMAHALVSLAGHPDQRRLLAEDRSLIPQAVEEVLRWQTITQFIDRDVLAGGIELAGMALPEGAVVRVLHGAANRDPERWARAGEFDVTREPRQHLGFGFGMHSCLGLNLARLEAQIWLGRVLDLVPEYQLARRVDYGSGFQLRGPTAVYLALG